jgi:hypothetical protein
MVNRVLTSPYLWWFVAFGRSHFAIGSPSGADLTFANPAAANSQSERQIQSSTRIKVLLVVL